MTLTNDLTHFSISTDDDGVATVVMDRQGEPMNTLGPALMTDFELVLDRLETDTAIKAVVLTSAKKDFLVGADVRWFAELTDAAEAQAMIETGHRLFGRLEDLYRQAGKPVVAAIHGSALGGGLELALACSHRVLADEESTTVGQPEVQLGVIPAGGGCVRLPALIGVAEALDLILTGKPVRASKARKLGIADDLAPREYLMDAARALALSAIVPQAASRRTMGSILSGLSGDRLQKLALETNPVGQNVLFKQARLKLLAETNGNYPAPERALEAVRLGVQDGPEAGLRAEARFFGELVTSPESRALRSIFFATREVSKDNGVADTSVAPRPVGKVGVIGGGLMGGGIAAVSTLNAGIPVRIKETDGSGVERALGYVHKVLDERVRRRRLRDFEAERAMLRVTGTTDWSGFSGVDLVIEAVFEDLTLKQDILREVEAEVGAGTVFASNTSTLPISAIADASSRPETVLGMHYFSPVEKMPLLEVIVTDRTADWATVTAVDFGRRQGKTVIVVNDGTGFYTSRIIAPYSNEALHLLEEGASIEAIDRAMVKWGFPVGPLLLADEVGLDVGQKVSRIMVDAFGDRMAGPGLLDNVSDRKGRKNGKGFYLYDEKGKRGEPDETIYADLGLGARRDVPMGEIQERVSMMMINEAALCLQEGILRSARDGDIGAVMGLGFPPFRGGPFWYVDHVGAAAVVSRLQALASKHGGRFEPARILVEAAESGTNLRGPVGPGSGTGAA
jgi:3-hydroxyacyl-CoA dehydrogenase / enoyl-CoA hydratase / 3-hydroxybutyryl-CoA epimerase